MKLKDVPASTAYLVFHDAFDKGSMDVWPVDSFVLAKAIAIQRQSRLENMGSDEAGHYQAYEKLPRVRVHSFHPVKPTLDR